MLEGMNMLEKIVVSTLNGSLVPTQNQPEPCGSPLTSIDEWTPTLAPDDIMDMDQDDPELAEYICKNWLIPPPSVPRNLLDSSVVDYSQHGQASFVDHHLNHRTEGFYIESGAWDGETFSNTLYLEKNRNWKGLLVEPDPNMFGILFSKHRQTHMINACLSPTQHPQALQFNKTDSFGGLKYIVENFDQQRIDIKNSSSDMITVQCFPLVAILKAMNVKHVDYWSLDVEGAEVDVLFTMPLDEITVDVLSIEYAVESKFGRDVNATNKKLNELNEFLVGQYGYEFAKGNFFEEVMYVKPPRTRI